MEIKFIEWKRSLSISKNIDVYLVGVSFGVQYTILFASYYNRVTLTILTVTFWLLYTVDWTKIVISNGIPISSLYYNRTRTIALNLSMSQGTTKLSIGVQRRLHSSMQSDKCFHSTDVEAIGLVLGSPQSALSMRRLLSVSSVCHVML